MPRPPTPPSPRSAEPPASVDMPFALPENDGPPSVPGVGSRSQPPELPGFELLGELGRGGMGVVFKARQVRLGRTVALKMILAGGLADARGVARFRAEAEALGRLQHPNIVQVYEVGEHNGLPFFALEYCAGGSLAAKSGGAPQPPRKAAGLVAVIAEAMQAAHSAGIVHRDLKPANILLTGNGIPKITDFGLAKRTDSVAGPTRTGEAMGTPAYMAPEQLGEGTPVGPAADVYALGAVLYDLLTGRPPFLGESEVNTIWMLMTQDPVPLRRLQPKAPADLEVICDRCLQKDPARRYPSAAALAEDLRLFLAGSPIRARPAGPWERTVKWVRRKPTAAALAAVSVLAGLGAAVGGTVWAVQVRAERDRAEAALAEAESSRAEAAARRAEAEAARAEADAQRRRAETGLKIAKAAVDKYFTGVSQNQLLATPGLADLRHELLGSAAEFYERLSAHRGDGPVGRREFARALARLAGAELELGRFDKAEEHYRRAADEYAALGDEAADEIADVHGSLSRVMYKLGRADEGLAEARRGEALWTRLAEARPDDPQIRLHLSRARNNVASLLAEAGRHAEAVAAHESALQLAEELVRSAPGDPAFRGQAALVHMTLGARLNVLDRHDAAAAHLQTARRMFGELCREDPTDRDRSRRLAATEQELSQILRRAGRFDEAAECLRSAVILRQRLAVENPQIPDYLFQLAVAQEDYSQILRAGSRNADALKPAEAAAQTLGELSRRFPDAPDYRRAWAGAQLNLGLLLLTLGRFEEAAEVQRAGLAVQRELCRRLPDNARYTCDLAAACNGLGGTLMVLKRFDAAASAMAEGARVQAELADRRPEVPEYRRRAATHRGNLGAALRQCGRLRESAEAYRAAIADGRRLVSEQPDDAENRIILADALANSALTLADLGEVPEAERRLREAFQQDAEAIRRDQAGAPRHRIHAVRHLTRLSELLLKNGRVADAGKTALEAGKFRIRDATAYLEVAKALSAAAGRAAGDEAARWDDAAIKALRDAAAVGRPDPDALERDAGLARLAGRPDFRAVVAEFRSRAPSRSGGAGNVLRVPDGPDRPGVGGEPAPRDR